MHTIYRDARDPEHTVHMVSGFWGAMMASKQNILSKMTRANQRHTDEDDPVSKDLESFTITKFNHSFGKYWTAPAYSPRGAHRGGQQSVLRET